MRGETQPRLLDSLIPLLGRRFPRLETCRTIRGERQPRLLDSLIVLLLSASTLALYLKTLAPTILPGDGGEFQFVPYLLGVAHPTGYPLYSLLGWFWSRLLPVGDIAYRMNLFSAVAAALAVGLFYPTARTLLRLALPHLSPVTGRLVAAAGALTFAVTPTLWSQAVMAEVYGLQILLVVSVLYLLLRWAERRNDRLLVAAAGIFGLGLAHHSTTLLLAPAVALFLWLTDRRVYRNLRITLPALAAILLPLALYLYIPLRAPHTPYLNLPLSSTEELVLYDNTLPGLLRFVTGGPFGGSLDLKVDLAQRLAMAGELVRDEIGWIGLGLALVGLGQLVLHHRWALLALSGLYYAASVTFNLFYTIGDIFVLFIPSYLVIVLWLGLGVAAVSQLGAGWSRKRWVGALVVLPLFLLAAWRAQGHYATIDQSQRTGTRNRWETILTQPLPPDAILISNDRNDIMPMWYLQYIEDRRPDLLGLFPLITEEVASLGQVLDLAMSTERAAFLIKEMPGIEVKADVAPEGTFWRVLGPAADSAPAYARNDCLSDAVALAGYDCTPRSPAPGETLAVRLYWQALRPLDAEYHTFVHLVDEKGRLVAQSDQQPGGVYYPTTLWQSGERLRDDHNLTLPVDTPPGVYQLVAGMYALAPGDKLEPLGKPIIAGQVAVKRSPAATPPAPHLSTTAVFGGQIALLGYDVHAQNGTLAVALHWQCLEPPTNEYTVFVHLLDERGQTVTQHDGQPQDGRYPTSVWDAGETIIDRHLLPLPADLTPKDLTSGNYQLRIGLYLAETGDRLPLDGGGDGLELGSLSVDD